MNIEELRDYCLSKPHVKEGFPFGEETLVFKVGQKMFALAGLESEDPYVNLKCNPEYAIELREKFESVTPGYHMNKKHWNTVRLSQELSNRQIQHFINHSYELVVKSLTKKVKIELGL